jgi:chorismate mutase
MSIFKRTRAVRGAVCCDNTKESISSHVPSLYGAILSSNGLTEKDVVSVVFSVTPDLTAVNPATALRLAGLAASVPLFAAAEPAIEGMMPRVIRLLITYRGRRDPRPVYLNGAEALRPDMTVSTPANERA